MSKAAIDLVRQVYDNFARRDVASMLELSADDVVITQDPALPWGGRYHGHDGVVEFLNKLTTALESTITTEQLFCAGDDVVQCGRSRGTIRSTGKVVDVPECHIWTIRNWRIVRAQFFIDSAPVLAAIAEASTPSANPG